MKDVVNALYPVGGKKQSHQYSYNNNNLLQVSLTTTNADIIRYLIDNIIVNNWVKYISVYNTYAAQIENDDIYLSL